MNVQWVSTHNHINISDGPVLERKPTSLAASTHRKGTYKLMNVHLHVFRYWYYPLTYGGPEPMILGHRTTMTYGLPVYKFPQGSVYQATQLESNIWVVWSLTALSEIFNLACELVSRHASHLCNFCCFCDTEISIFSYESMRPELVLDPESY